MTFPDSDTGEVKMLFTKRNVQTAEFQIDDDEWSFYDALTRYVEEQSIKAAEDDSARGRALGFTIWQCFRDVLLQVFMRCDAVLRG